VPVISIFNFLCDFCVLSEEVTKETGQLYCRHSIESDQSVTVTRREVSPTFHIPSIFSKRLLKGKEKAKEGRSILLERRIRHTHGVVKMMKGDPTGVYCKEHPDAPLVEDYRAGDQICSECGLVVGDRVIDVGSEWRTFSNEKANADPSRVGGPENPLLNGSDLSTMIGGGRGEAAFDEFGVAKYQNRRSVTNSDRTLLNSFREIAQMADRINLPRTIQDRANNLFKMVHDGKNLKGRSNDAIASASLYIACRQEGVPRTFKEICAVSKISNIKEGNWAMFQIDSEGFGYICRLDHHWRFYV